jgi:hypothetical protein
MDDLRGLDSPADRVGGGGQGIDTVGQDCLTAFNKIFFSLCAMAASKKEKTSIELPRAKTFI